MRSPTRNAPNHPLATAEPLLWTLSEAARQCGVSPRTVQRWIAAGDLPVVRFSTRATRIPSAAVRALIARAARLNAPPLAPVESPTCAARQLAEIIHLPNRAKRR